MSTRRGFAPVVLILGLVMVITIAYFASRLIINPLKVGQLSLVASGVSGEANNLTGSANPALSSSITPSSRDTTAKEANGALLESYKLTIDNSQWIRLNSKKLGLSFEYPFPSKGDLLFRYSDFGDNSLDPSGQIYSWEFKSTDPKGDGWTYTIASGVSSSFKLGRDDWYTDFHKLESSDFKDVIKVYKTKFETQAILKYAPTMMSVDHPNDVVLKMELPFSRDQRFKGLALYVKDGLTDNEATRIVNSVKFE